MKHATTIAALAMLLLTGCRGIVEPREANPFADPAATPAAPPTRTATDLCDSDDGPPGVLAAISTSSLADRDRVVFQFHGQAVPDVTATYVDRITEDPTDRPVPLVGSTFLSVVFHGGRLDTAAIEPDPSAVVRYDGSTRLAPSYPILLELAVSGDFEAVLSFGLGLSHRTTVRTTTPPGRACVILDVMRSANAATW